MAFFGSDKRHRVFPILEISTENEGIYPKRRRIMKKTYLGLRKKLLSALAMLLVATILMVSSTYAWFVLSTAPEVTGIQTQVGANGSLEIALVNQESWNDLTKLDMGDIDESATENLGSANLTWGNLVNLADTSYGLRDITLNPARLAISQNGNNAEGTAITYTIADSLLKVPVYTEDGRVQRLDTAHVVNYIYDGKGFTMPGYGVRAIGTASQMSQFQLGMNAARNNIANHRAAAKTTASNTLTATGAGLGNIVVQYALQDKKDGFNDTDMTYIKDMAAGLVDALDEIGAGLRAVFAGYITTTASGITAENYDAELAYINDTAHSLSDLLARFGGITAVIPEMSSYITTLEADRTVTQTAVDNANKKIEEKDSFKWEEITAIVTPLVNIDQMTLGGKTIDEVKKMVTKDKDGNYNVGDLLPLIQNGIVIAAPSGSGVISDIADYAGDYAASVKVGPVKISGFSLDQVDATVTTQTAENPVRLTNASNALSNALVSDATGSNSLTDFFGYAIDLAFRTNAEKANLLLQTEPKQRIYDTSNNADTLGGGSYMSFRSDAGLSATKMVKLMSGIRVVFMDKSNNVLAIAALDTTLGKDRYVELSEDEKKSTGKFAYLNASQSQYQQSDLIDATTYNGLPDKSSVQYKDGTLSAKLYIVSFSMTESKGHKDEEGKFYTGGITIGTDRTENGTILALKPDEATIVTALVYLDGSVVNNSMVAANATQSMSGVLNLQFSSSAELIPMQYTPLQNGDGQTGGGTDQNTGGASQSTGN